MITYLPGEKHYIIMPDYAIFTDFYRAQVTEVDIEGNAYGAVRVFIPDLMIEGVEPNFGSDPYGIVAYPANAPIGGYNMPNEEDSKYANSVYVPLKGSWVWVRFENGNTSRCFYTSSFQCKQAMVPPENRNVDTPHKVYTIIKSQSGRAIIVCDSEDQQRVEITGKKREIKDPVEGDNESVYKIDDNMTTILLDERDGKEKLLIRTHKGDFLNIDIENRKLQGFFEEGIILKTNGNIDIQAKKDVNIKVGGDMKTMVGGKIHQVSTYTYIYQAEEFHLKSSKYNFIHATRGTKIDTGAENPTKPKPENPKGERE